MSIKATEGLGLDKPGSQVKRPLNIIVIVAALGYFVDIYDLVLFGIVRKSSLETLGVTTPEGLKTIGESLLNWQMGGMLLGGIMWGMLGDKKGRLSVLFGSIIMYSLANIANGFVDRFMGPDGDNTLALQMYAALRFIAGVGLAGELGAGITLVSETMSKERRGYGTMIVATVGVFGAVVASLIAGKASWQDSYFIGGGMGLALLLLRIGVYESSMFKNITHNEEVRKGNFQDLFTSWPRLKRYLCVILIAVPVWFLMGRLIFFAPDYVRELDPTIPESKLPSPATAIMFAYIGITIGDLVNNALSQLIKSRKKVLFLFISLSLLSGIIYLFFATYSNTVFYAIATFLGIATGYWAVFVTTASETFGTNMRATVTTTSPNFVRGAVLPISWGIGGLTTLGTSMITSTIIIGIVVFALGYWAVSNLEETFGKDLDYIEKD